MTALTPPDDRQPTAEEMVRFFDAEIYGAEMWLKVHDGQKDRRPAHDIAVFENRLRMRQWARYGYARLAEANRARAMEANDAPA